MVISLKKCIFLIICFIIAILVYEKSDDVIIPNDAIRVRIIANSNSISDLYSKKVLKESIKDDLYNIVKDANSTLEADSIIKNNLDKIEDIVSNKTSDFSIDYGKNYFPKKVYKDVIYNEGEYESLVVTLGEGNGHNFWCVLFPPLCLVDEQEENIEYKSFVKEIIKKYF